MGGMGRFVDQIDGMIDKVSDRLTQRIANATLTKGVISELKKAVASALTACEQFNPKQFVGALEAFLNDCATLKCAASQVDKKEIETSLSSLRKCAERLQAPRRLLRKLVTTWFKGTGHRITRIFRVFVTPKPIGEKVRSKVKSLYQPENDTPLRLRDLDWEVEMVADVRFVSVDLVRFLPFDAVRQTRPPPLYGMNEPIRVTKSVDDTPPMPAAADVATQPVSGTDDNAVVNGDAAGGNAHNAKAAGRKRARSGDADSSPQENSFAEEGRRSQRSFQRQP